MSRQTAEPIGTTRDLTIRQATRQDAPLLAELGRQTFYDAYAADLPADRLAAYVAATFSFERQLAELADPAAFFLIAEVGGAAAGYAALREEPGPAAGAGHRHLKLLRLYLRPEWIGRGVGAALMQASLAEAERRGFDIISLDVWEKNARAQAFYRKWGFVEASRTPFHFLDEAQTDLVMQRPIGSPAAPLSQTR